MATRSSDLAANTENTELDVDPEETQEWLDALDATIEANGHDRGFYLLSQLLERAQNLGVASQSAPFSAYRNTIPLDAQKPYPGNQPLEERITSIIRWNALAMVVRANEAHGELGGHIGSYASSAEIFELGFNHFFRGNDGADGADLVFFQPHSAPGIYARSFLEGRLSESHLEKFRLETDGGGLSSYPHPWLMPDFWQFPTGSMGIGPINAIYQARFMRYLSDRGIISENDRRVWGIFGDGEMDEPESLGALTLAARERLDNVTFIVNCNLQRLDGPVRGNGQIIRELEALFVGAGWNVIKVLWGSNWDTLFSRDKNHDFLRAFAAMPDGEYQTLGAKDGGYNLEHFFGKNPALRSLVSHMSESDVDALKRGGHDFRKLHAAFQTATEHRGQPTVILAKTKKGFGMGRAGESKMSVHQQKKLNMDALRAFRDRFALPLNDHQIERMEFYRPDEDSPEITYLRERRSALGGAVPLRISSCDVVPVPEIGTYANFALNSNGKRMSTTVAIVRLITNLLRDKEFGPKIVPIVADEARTFGMDSLFRQIGIYAPDGQLYEPEDAGSLSYYKESKNGQLLEEGINEAGALSSWTAAATSYSVHGVPMLPFYIFYSMFGFQRVGDLIWAAADQRARGFLIGATAGRTTLSGEGLQHQDGASHLLASAVPNCRAYDPAFAGEVAIILDHGARAMLEQQEDVFYYITVMNENYPQPSMPSNVEEDVVKGLYRLERVGTGTDKVVQLLGSGTILCEVIEAAQILMSDWGVTSEVFSATSYSELARDARATERANRLQPENADRISHVRKLLRGSSPVIATSDYVCAVPQQVASYIDAPFVALGTDGFGRSDTRSALRRFFEVDRHHIVVAALKSLVDNGCLNLSVLKRALSAYDIAADDQAPWTQ